MNQNSLLQNRINELYSAIINFVDNKVYITGFYNAKMLECYLNTQKDNHQSKGIYDRENIDFSEVQNNALFVIQENGIEIKRIQYQQIFKDTLKSANSIQKLVVIIRKDKYSNQYVLTSDKSSILFENETELNQFLNDNYQTTIRFKGSDIHVYSSI